MIEIRNASKQYRAHSGEIPVLRQVSLQVAKGDFISIVGKSGSGKSTLLNCIGLLDRFDTGEYRFLGKEIAKLSTAKLAMLRNRSMGFVFQSCHLEYAYSVYENLCIPMYIQRASRKEIDRRAAEVLELVGLQHTLRRRANELSGGEQQRINIARALMCDPDLILADEPCGNLDTENSNGIMNILAELPARGKTVLLITHDNEAAARAHRQLQIADGEVWES
ncbi:MAG: ABC transporter ATP-binding protein [Oscillospiraceae bacterium]|nr:ABC transporter ATP-binding protein [Oscillospiraceae bacterium]